MNKEPYNIHLQGFAKSMQCYKSVDRLNVIIYLSRVKVEKSSLMDVKFYYNCLNEKCQDKDCAFRMGRR